MGQKNRDKPVRAVTSSNRWVLLCLLAQAANRRSAAEAGEKLDEAGALAVLEEVQAEGGAAALQKLLPKMSVEGGLAVKVSILVQMYPNGNGMFIYMFFCVAS